VSGQPLYLAVRDRLLDRITSGQVPPGGQLPSEAQLAAEFGCGRLTVHRAVRELADAGYVERRRRAGTRVARRGTREMHLAIARIADEVAERGHAYRYELLSRRLEPADAATAAALEVPAGRRLLHILCRHWAGARVFQHEDRWINLAAVPAAAAEPFLEAGPNHWLLDHVPFSEVEHEIAATAATDAEAAALLVAPGTALLRIRRRTTSRDRRITCVEVVYSGDLFALRSGPQPG
jgi:GntR family histidine utilization transcriptional repressor